MSASRRSSLAVAVLLCAAALAMAADETRNVTLPGVDSNWSDPNWLATGTTTLVHYPWLPGDVARVGRGSGTPTLWVDDPNVYLGRFYITAGTLNIGSRDNGIGAGRILFDTGVTGGQAFFSQTTGGDITAPLVLNNTLVYRMASTGTMRFNGPISGNGGLAVFAPGSSAGQSFLILQGNNTYAGTTVVTGAGFGRTNNASGVQYVAWSDATASGGIQITNKNAIPDKTITLNNATANFYAWDDANRNWQYNINIGSGLNGYGEVVVDGNIMNVTHYFNNLTFTGDAMAVLNSGVNVQTPATSNAMYFQGLTTVVGTDILFAANPYNSRFMIGRVEGSGTLVKAGGGVLQLMDGNSSAGVGFTGGFVITAGTVISRAQGALGLGQNVVGNFTAGDAVGVYLQALDGNQVLVGNTTIRDGAVRLGGDWANQHEGGNFTIDSSMKGLALDVIRVEPNVTNTTNRGHEIDSLTFVPDAKLLVISQNTAMLGVTGSTTLQGGVNVIQDTDRVFLYGQVTGNGQFKKLGAGVLLLNNITNNFSGGLLMTGSGRIVAAGAPGAVSTLGTGNVTLGDQYLRVDSGSSGQLILLTDANINDAPTTYANNIVATADRGYAGFYLAPVAYHGADANWKNVTQVITGNLTVGNNVTLGVDGNATALQTLRIMGTTNVTGPAYFHTQTAGIDLRLSGPVVGAGTLAKTGAGRLVLDHYDSNFVNTFNGAKVFQGTLQLSAANTLSGALSIFRGGIVESNVADALNGASIAVPYNGNTAARLRAWDSNSLNGASINVAGNLDVWATTNGVHVGGNLTVDSAFVAPTITYNPSTYTTKNAYVDSLTVGASGSYLSLDGSSSGNNTLHVAGTTLLQGGDFVITTKCASTNFAMDGNISGAGRLVVQSGGNQGILYLGSAVNDWTGGMLLKSDIVQAAGGLGSGDIAFAGQSLATGNTPVLRIYVDSNYVYSNNLSVAADSTGQITLGAAAAGSNLQVCFNNLSLANRSAFTMTGGNSYDLVILGQTIVSGKAKAYSNDSGSDLVLAGALVGDSSSVLMTGSRSTYVVQITGGDDANFLGALGAQAGVTRLGDAGQLRNATLMALPGGTLLVDNIGTANLNDRIGDTKELQLRGGTFQYRGANGADSNEYAASLRAVSSASTYTNTLGSGTASSIVVFGTLNQNKGATIDFTSTNLGLTNAQVRFTTAPTLVGNLDPTVAAVSAVLPGVTVGGLGGGWATYDPNLGVIALPASGTIANLAETSWDANMNIRIDANVQLTGERSVNTIVINKAFGGSNGAQNRIDVNGNTLRVTAGGIMDKGYAAWATLTDSVGTGALTTGLTGGSLYIDSTSSNGSGQKTIFDVAIKDANTDAPVSVVVYNGNAANSVVFLRTNTYSDGTYLNGGTLEANKAGSLGSGKVVFSGGTLKLGDALNQSFNLPMEVSPYSTGTVSISTANATDRFTTLAMGDQGTLVLSSNSVLQFTGATTLAGDAYFQPTGTAAAIRLEGAVGGAGTMIVSSSATGTVYLTAANNFSGGWRIDAGAIDANAAGALGGGNGLMRAGSLYARVANVLDSAATVTADSGATINLYAAQSQSTGKIVLAGGTLNLRNDANTNMLVNVETALTTRNVADVSTISAARVGASALSMWLNINNLTLNPGTILSVNSTNTYAVAALGTTTLAGSSILTGNATLYLNGQVTGAGSLTNIAGTVVMGNSTNNFTGDLFVQGGTVRGTAANALGVSSGQIYLDGGTLSLQSDTAGVSYAKDVTLVSDSTINVDRITAGGLTNQTQSLRNFTGGDYRTVTVSGTTAVGADLAFTGTTTLNGPVAFAVSTANTDVVFSGTVTGPGTLIKQTTGTNALITGQDTNLGWTGGARVDDGNLVVTGRYGLGTGNTEVRGGNLVLMEANATLNGSIETVFNGGKVFIFGKPQDGTTITLDGGPYTTAAALSYNLALLATQPTDYKFNLVVNPSNNDLTGRTLIYVDTPGVGLGIDPNKATYGPAQYGVVHTIGNLTLNSGAMLVVGSDANRGHKLRVGGTTTVNGDVILQSYNVGADLILAGNVVGSGNVMRYGGGGNLVLNAGHYDYTGTWTLYGNASVSGLQVTNTGDANAMGNGSTVVLKSSGFLMLYTDLNNTANAQYRTNVVADQTATTYGPTIYLSTVTQHLIGGGDSNIDPAYKGVRHQLGSLTLANNSQLISDGNASYQDVLEFTGNTNLINGGGTIAGGNSAQLHVLLSGTVTGSGRLSLAQGGWVELWGAGNNYTGGTYIGFAGSLYSYAVGGLGTGGVMVTRSGVLTLKVAGAANANAVTFQGCAAGTFTSVLNGLSGTSSAVFDQVSMAVAAGQNYTGGTTLLHASELTASNYDTDANIAGNPLGAGQVTIDQSSILTARSNVNFTWGNDMSLPDGGTLIVDRVSGSGTGKLQTFGALVASNQTLSPTNIVRNNGYQVAFSGLDLTGGLTISGLDLSFNRDPAKRVSILGATNLTVSADANLYIGGTADMLTDTVVDANFHLSIVNNNQVFVTGTAIHNAGNVSGPGLAASGRTNIAAGATLGVTRIRQQQVDVSGKLVLNGGSGPATSIVNALNIAGVTDAWTGLVDIRQGYLVLPSATASDVGNQVKQASNFAAFGSWDGTGGITSSSAAGDQLYGVGYADNAIAKKSEFGEANGLAYTGVLVRYTYVGDTNLDGITDLDKDYYNWSFGYLNAGNNTWYYGDFNYDGQVDLDKDYYIWSYGYLNQGSPLVGGAESAVDTSPSSAPVPEPATVGLLGLGLLGLLRRRSRKA